MITFLRWILAAGAFCFIACVTTIDTARAHDFGGSTDPEEGTEQSEKPDPCDKNPPCECLGGGNQSGDNGTNGPPQSGHQGQPVSLRTGEENHNRTDLVVSGVYPIRIARSYQSRARYDSRLGYGWSFNHDRRLFEYPDDSVVIRYSCGQTMRFIRTGGAYVTPQDGPQGDLVENVDGSFEYTYYDGLRDQFDADGRLVATIHREGHRHEYLYDAGGKLPLTGTSPYAVDPDQPMVVAYMPQLTRIQERSADGQLTGVFVDFDHDATTGRVTRAVASDGREITYTHDTTPGDLTRGNVIQVEGPDGLFSEYQYQSPHGNHLMTSMQQGATSEPIVNTYDAEGRVVQQVHGFQVLDFDYQVPLTRTQVTRTITDDQGTPIHSAVTTVHFDVEGYVTKHVDPFGHELRYFYDASKNVDQVEWWDNSTGTLVLDRTVNYSHDAKSRLLSSEVTLDSGETITKTWTYDGGWVASEQVVSSADPAQIFRTEYTFIRDGLGVPLRIHQTKQIGPGGTARTTTNTYCDATEIGQPGSDCPFEGLIKSIDGPRTDVADVTTFTYYAATDTSGCGLTDGPCHRKGQLHTTTNALGHTEEILRYNLAGDPLRMQSANGLITDFEYDGRRRLTAIKVRGSDPTSETDDLITTLAYDANGNLIKRTAPDGSFVAFAYDARDRLIEITDNLGNRIAYTLGSEGNRLKEETFDPTDTLTRTLSSTFDPLNRLASQATAASETTTFGYDRNGNLVSQQDPIPGRGPTINQYDDLNRLIQTTDPASGITQYAYDANGSLTQVIDPNGHSTVYTYNALGDLLQLDSPDSGTTGYTYDEAGNRQTQTDARGITANHTYDALNRLTDIVYPDDPTLNVTYTYDQSTNGIGQLTGMADDSGSTAWTYDPQGRVTAKTQTVAGTALTMQYQYDAGGRLAGVVYPDGAVVDYGFDLAGRLAIADVTPSGASGASGLIDDLSYLPFGPVSNIDFSGSYPDQNRNYDLDYRPTALSGPLARNYTTDPVGNITAISKGTDTWSYDYDDLYRVETVTDPLSTVAESFAYDANGNRTSHDGASYAIDPASNRLTQAGAVTYQYDAMGNTTQITGDPNGDLSLVYGAHQRLLNVNNNTGPQGQYRYNGRGERVYKEWTGSTGPMQVRIFLYDERGRVIGEYATNGTPVAQYFWADDLPAGILKDGNLHAIHADHLTTPRAVTDASGTTIWRWSSLDQPFGESLPDDDPDGDTVAFELNLRFPGQYFDEETELHHNGFRTYDPSLGKYLQPDPIGLEESDNLYPYVNSNPIIFFDPEGEAAQAAVGLCFIPGVGWVGCGAAAALGGAIACAISPDLCRRALEACLDLFNEEAPDSDRDGRDDGDDGSQDKRLTKREIKKLKDAGIHPHDLKDNSRQDLFKDRKGNISVKPKNGSGPGDSTGLNINDF